MFIIYTYHILYTVLITEWEADNYLRSVKTKAVKLITQFKLDFQKNNITKPNNSVKSPK